MKTKLLTLLLLLAAAGTGLAQKDEITWQNEILERWDAMVKATNQCRADLEAIQIRYSGEETPEGRAAIEKEYEATAKVLVDQAKAHVADVAEFLETFPENRPVRDRRISCETLSWIDYQIRTDDCLYLYEQTKAVDYLDKAADFRHKAYDYERCAEIRKQITELQPSIEHYQELASAMTNAYRFAEARQAYLDGSAIAAEDKDKKRLATAAEIAQGYVDDWKREEALREEARVKDDLPMAEIVTERGTMIVELFEDQAPNTVANFIVLAEKGFFDDHLFFRNVANFVIQGGCPLDTGIGGPGYLIPDEFELEGARRHYVGTLSMANLSSQPNTAGSQFFITTSVTGQLNGRHTAFGRVLSGLEAAQVRGLDVSGRANPFKLEKIRILRKRDHDYAVRKLE